MVNPMGDSERVEYRMAQIERTVHEAGTIDANEKNAITGKFNPGAQASRKEQREPWE
jgi:hypothetical protein